MNTKQCIVILDIWNFRLKPKRKRCFFFNWPSYKISSSVLPTGAFVAKSQSNVFLLHTTHLPPSFLAKPATMSHHGSALAFKGKAPMVAPAEGDGDAGAGGSSSRPRPGLAVDTEEARARREAEKADLEKNIARVKEEIAALEAELAKTDAAAPKP